MELNKGDEILIRATVKFADENNGMVLAETQEGGFYVRASDIVDRGYYDGLREAWEMARRITQSPEFGGYTAEELMGIFNSKNPDYILNKYSAKCALDAARRWEERTALAIGDVVTADSDERAVIAGLHSDMCYLLWQDGTCDMMEKAKLVKTGKHINMTDFLNQIGDDE